MTRIEELRALLGRVQAATGPDQELDAAIGWHIGGWKTWTTPTPESLLAAIEQFGLELDQYSASLDAALMLVERCLPGWSVGCRRSGLSEHADAEVWNPLTQPGLSSHEMFRASNNVSSPPLALCAALLSALIARHEEGTEQ